MTAIGLFYKPVIVEEVKEVQPQEEMLMVPLKNVEINAVLSGATAMVNFEMTYANYGTVPMECTYEFPLESETIFSKLVITLEDKKIEAVV